MTIQANDLVYNIGSGISYKDEGSIFSSPVSIDNAPIPDYKPKSDLFSPYKIDTSAEVKGDKTTLLANGNIIRNSDYFLGFNKQETFIGLGFIIVILFLIWK